MGRRMESAIHLTTYEQNKQFAYKSISESSPFQQSFLFETTAGGTKLSTVIKLETAGLLGLAKPLIALGLKRDMGADFGFLKNLSENRVPAVAA